MNTELAPQPMALPAIHDAVFAALSARASKGRKLLDLGCGQGAWLERIRPLGLQAVGADWRRDRFRGTEQFVEVDLNLPFAHKLDGPFDYLTSIEVIEHLENPSGFLRECAHLMHRDSRLIITTPNIESVGARVRFLLTGELRMFGPDPATNDPTHITPIHSGLFRRLAARANLEILEHLSDETPAANRWITRSVVRSLAPLLRGYQGNNCHVFILALRP
jgi:2-polyprenyl-3-methyl-5-hydroxy-6-metoxy-1,4-benzoquinol methylase